MPSGALAVSFTLDADLHRLRMPSRRPPRFADGLWRHTCFEVFLARKGARAYREYNFSPSGEWAGYAFSSYRKRIAAKIVRPRRRGKWIEIQTEGRLRIGLCAVIEEKGGALSYWALRHPPGKPDFHHRHAFAMQLP
jgi:hypothetical protein